MTKKRNKLEIMHSILKIIDLKSNCRATNILFKANLSHTMFDKYINELVDKDIIIIKEINKTTTYYKLSNIGLELLIDLNFLMDKINKYEEKYKIEITSTLLK